MESGQALLLVIVGLSLFVLGALGLAIDGAQLYAHRQMAQTAADAAAQAGAMSIFAGTNATGANPFAIGSPPNSFICSTTDGRTPCVYAAMNGFGGSSDTVTVSFPTAVAGVTLNPAQAVPAITVTIQRTVKGSLIQMLGIAATTVSAKATASIVGTVPETCLYTLDPSGSKVFQINGGSNVTVNCAVSVNSTAADAGSLTGGSTLTATAVQGRFETSGGSTIMPEPTSLPQPVTDPYLNIPAPPVASSCNPAHTNYRLGSGYATISPGTYCGGIGVTAGGSLTFNPGIYVIKGGSLSFAGGSSGAGSHVLFYLTGTDASYGGVSVGGGANLNFTAPSSGTYIGLLFFQDRSLTPGVTADFSGGTTMQLSGGLYFPTTTIKYAGGAVSNVIAMVAKNITFTGGSRILYDPTGITTGLNVVAVGLVE